MGIPASSGLSVVVFRNLILLLFTYLAKPDDRNVVARPNSRNVDHAAGRQSS